MNAQIIVALVILVVFLLLTWPRGDRVKVYGTLDCGWTRKQLNNLQGRAEFFDCAKNQCPDFVKAYPTCEKAGKLYEGYQENI